MAKPRINFSRLLNKNFQNISEDAINFMELSKQLLEVSIITINEVVSANENEMQVHIH